MKAHPFPFSFKRGFTLIELLLSIAILSILMVILVTITGQTSAVWRSTTGKAEQFREARTAFESITRNLSQATLNTYYDYYDSTGARRTNANVKTFVPAKYGRYSELRFRCDFADVANFIPGGSTVRPTQAIFFQAPLGFTEQKSYAGLGNLLNTWGYYIEFRTDSDRPDFITNTGSAEKYRYRLIEFMEPTENLGLYKAGANWLQNATDPDKTHVLATNIIALVFLPKLPSQGPVSDPTVDADGGKLAPRYRYDSTTTGDGYAVAGSAAERAAVNSFNQLPPIVEVTMVAIDEASAMRLDNGAALPNFTLDGLFENASLAQKRADLLTLQNRLTNAKVSYRVFSTEVSLRGAKWSREQIN